MTNVLIIGATGSLGQVVRQYLLEHTNDKLRLMARDVSSIQNIDPEREQTIQGSVTDQGVLFSAMENIDAVFASLRGDMAKMAQALVDGMNEAGLRRLIFVTSLGIYNEVPEEIDPQGNLKDKPVLRDYRHAADIVESSGLNYVILRPGWFDDGDDTDYQLTSKGEPFVGHDISRKSIADLVMRLTDDPGFGVRQSYGISRKTF